MFHRLRQWMAVSLVLMPAMAQSAIVLDGALTYEQAAAPGSHYSGAVPLRNAGSEPAAVRVYQTDYHFQAGGQNAYGPPGRHPRSNASWTRLSQEQLTLAPGQRVQLRYLVQVPDNPHLQGTYWSLLMVEEAPVAEHPPAAQQPGVQLAVKMRYGIQLVTQIGDATRPQVSFRNPRLLEHKEGLQLQVDLENTGQRWIRPALSLQLFHDNGQPLGTFEGERQRLYPGTSVRTAITLPGVPSGRYRGLLIADGGGNALFGTQIQLTVP